ncbi:MAG: universal stress protein, partial [Chthoniobacteraceae bacterium]
RIVETALGAALGATFAGPAGAVAGGLMANRAASRLKNLGEPKRRRKQSKPAADSMIIHASLKRILVPLDFSPPSLRALRFARNWALRFRAEVCLLHVIESISTAVPFAPEPITLPAQPLNFRRRFTDAIEKLARKEFPHSLKISIHLREGIPYHEIVDAAQKLKSDVIILATHGRSGLIRALIGSTAERVVRHAPCPVLVLR